MERNSHHFPECQTFFVFLFHPITKDQFSRLPNNCSPSPQLMGPIHPSKKEGKWTLDFQILRFLLKIYILLKGFLWFRTKFAAPGAIRKCCLRWQACWRATNVQVILISFATVCEALETLCSKLVIHLLIHQIGYNFKFLLPPAVTTVFLC